MAYVEIKTNPEQNDLYNRNGMAKLSAIVVTAYSSRVDIRGLNSKGFGIRRGGFCLQNDPAVLRALGNALLAAAAEAETAAKASA